MRRRLLAQDTVFDDRRAWVMRQERKTPNYTTCWESMPTAVA